MLVSLTVPSGLRVNLTSTRPDKFANFSTLFDVTGAESAHVGLDGNVNG